MGDNDPEWAWLRCNITNWAGNLGEQRRLPGGFFFVYSECTGLGRFFFSFSQLGDFLCTFHYWAQLNSEISLSFSLSIAVLVSWRVGSLLLVPLCIKLEL